MLADLDLTLHNQLGLCQPACTYTSHTKGKDQFAPIEIEETRAIANVTIRVEHTIAMEWPDKIVYLPRIPIDFVMIKLVEKFM